MRLSPRSSRDKEKECGVQRLVVSPQLKSRDNALHNDEERKNREAKKSS